jgi:release factor glutamine methyltransferase
MTVLEVIQRSSEFLARKGVESPRLQVELLLAHVLQLPRLKLYLNFDRKLTEVEAGQLREMVQRRGEREPLQHIIGSTSFCGFEFAVTRDVLVPRPETELLAERAWQHLDMLINGTANPDGGPAVLDIGTGCGCLAITLAVKRPTVRVHATDISAPALSLARANSQRYGVAERVVFYCGDLLAALPAGLKFDVIVSNPPYISTKEIETLQPEVRAHDPRAALDGGPDGLLFYRRLAREAPAYLAEDGLVMAEFGDDQDKAVAAIFVEAGWEVREIVRDLAGKSRIIVAGR